MAKTLLGLALAVASALATQRWLAPRARFLHGVGEWPGWLRAVILLTLVLTLGLDTVQGRWWLGAAYGGVVGLFPPKPKARPVPPTAPDD